MSDAVVTQQRYWQGLLAYMDEQAEVARAEALDVTADDLDAAEARGRCSAFVGVATAMREQHYELSPTCETALIEAQARANLAEGLLLELGRLTVQEVVQGANPQSQTRMMQILLPYVEQAMPGGSAAIQ